ncbi:hypothetical protein JMN11_00065 [Capnocytophaga genosp. AHN8471]|uniref:hypothetical protein n=1 Tax=Capnocytophaga genosp. AHN8471 TaxID=327574 RepID=UPI00193231E4|nr:hypothetical protein [Capnocytophaga genosp. AHN8471]MBM0652087.1 hypothetical protein [Capnocytophaga genosp. AHN8471]
MKYFLIFFVILLSNSCQLFQTQQPVVTTLSAETTQQAEEQQEEKFVPINKELYVINMNGAYRYSEPNKIGVDKKSHFFLGDRVKTIEESPHFYRIEDDKTSFVRKEDVGIYEDITLTKELLEATNTFFKENNKNAINKEVSNFSKYFSVALISREEYLSELKNKYSFLTEDTLSITKKNGVLTFPCKNTLLKLKDVDPQDETVENDMDMAIYSYKGRIDPIQQYVVYASYYEAGGCLLIDKNTGKKTNITDIPFLSPDNKYIVCLSYQPMDGAAISLYEITNKTPLFQLTTKVEANISCWQPYVWGELPIFFSKNGYLYASMNPSGCYYDQQGNLNKNRKYIKIKIK